MFKVNNKDARTTPFGVVLVSLLLTLNIFHTLCVSIVNFKHVIADWAVSKINRNHYSRRFATTETESIPLYLKQMKEIVDN